MSVSIYRFAYLIYNICMCCGYYYDNMPRSLLENQYKTTSTKMCLQIQILCCMHHTPATTWLNIVCAARAFVVAHCMRNFQKNESCTNMLHGDGGSARSLARSNRIHKYNIFCMPCLVLSLVFKTDFDYVYKMRNGKAATIAATLFARHRDFFFR